MSIVGYNNIKRDCKLFLGKIHDFGGFSVQSHSSSQSRNSTFIAIGARVVAWIFSTKIWKKTIIRYKIIIW